MPIGKHSALAAAADHLDRMVQDIKQQQYEATGMRQRPLPPRSGPDPQADWARRFSVWSLRPLQIAGGAAPLFAPPLAGQPKKPVFLDTAGPLDDRAAAPENQARHGSHIGALLGKAEAQRGLFNRLFRRDN